MTTIAALNDRYGIPDILTFREGFDGVPIATIANGSARSEVALHGGHVLSYIPAGEPQDMMYLSELVTCANGKAIRGGVPICWPWFGPDPEDKGRPSHGFARNSRWEPIASEAIDANTTKLVLGLRPTAATRALWLYDFELDLEVTVGDSLQLDLTTRNTGDVAFTISQGLHTYFAIGDIARTKVLGLEGKYYIDKLDAQAKKFQSDAIAFDCEVDRIYLDVAPEQIIDDAAFDRRIRITAANSKTAVVWNPWIDKSQTMGDFPDVDYQKMVCVETTNVADDMIALDPSELFCVSANYCIER